MNTSSLEQILQHPPQPAPPAGLKDRLLAQIPNSVCANPSEHPVTFRAWWARWWPALIPGSVSLACAAVFMAQQIEIHDLKTQVQELSQRAQNVAPASATPATLTSSPADGALLSAADETARLKATLARLSAEVDQLERLSAENQRLRGQRAMAGAGTLAPEETAQFTAALEAARERAERIQCINNLKQIGLALKVWGLDHDGQFPARLLDMTNELGSLKVLLCPAEARGTGLPEATSSTAPRVSYEFLAPLERNVDETEPTRVALKCPHHGNVGLADGSAQMAVAKEHPERLVTRDGKLFYGIPPASGSGRR